MDIVLAGGLTWILTTFIFHFHFTGKKIKPSRSEYTVNRAQNIKEWLLD